MCVIDSLKHVIVHDFQLVYSNRPAKQLYLTIAKLPHHPDANTSLTYQSACLVGFVGRGSLFPALLVGGWSI